MSQLLKYTFRIAGMSINNQGLLQMKFQFS